MAQFEKSFLVEALKERLEQLHEERKQIDRGLSPSGNELSKGSQGCYRNYNNDARGIASLLLYFTERCDEAKLADFTTYKVDRADKTGKNKLSALEELELITKANVKPVWRLNTTKADGSTWTVIDFKAFMDQNTQGDKIHPKAAEWFLKNVANK
jgi:hypothetical protein